MAEGGRAAIQADDEVVAAGRLRELEGRICDLERLLGRKTMEVEILREALSAARGKKPVWQLPSPPPVGSRWRWWPRPWAWHAPLVEWKFSRSSFRI